jgi:cytochrome c-type biogenesis protein CcmF
MNFFAERFGSNNFLGEHLWLGHFGHFLLVLSFIASILSFTAYISAEFNRGKENEGSWQKIARWAYGIHGASVFGVFVLLFLMILNHWFEYHYAWRHSSTTLPLKYIISSFWEGQEGSFLLWQFWIAVLGLIAIHTTREYESPVMITVALTQAFLGSMVLGIYILGYKVGSNPFVLLRDEMANAPIFARPEYLTMIKDGNGLNPLLQNYWMTIHPPVLFLGFASTVFPFAYAIASLLRREFVNWVKPALTWTLFCVGVLGTGILMGGAWAYESLSFGGFWAWDPVENMSFVPWLMIVAGLHTLMIYKYTKHSLISTYVFFILGFSFVLYSTFLTRSGILGDTSVHAFTDLGMTGQLLIYMFFFIIMGLTLLAIRIIKKEIPGEKKEEELFSREFWMFIGSLVLLLSALQMTLSTSIPVWNKLFSLNLAPPEDKIEHYNKFQILIGIVAALLTGAIQYLAYKTGKMPKTAKFAAYMLLASITLGLIIGKMAGIGIFEPHFFEMAKGAAIIFKQSTYVLLLIAAIYAVLGNLTYLFLVVKGNFKISGGSITHFGFGLFLIGALISQGKKEVISINHSGIDFGKEFKSQEKLENILLIRDSTYKMGEYDVTYTGTKTEKPNTLYSIKYERNDKDGKVKEEFMLHPNAQVNPSMGLLANPDTKHYLSKDVFTHVSSVPDNSNVKDTVTQHELKVGDTLFLRSVYVVFDSINANPKAPEGMSTDGKLIVGAQLRVGTLDKVSNTVEPLFIIDLKDNNSISSIPAAVEDLGVSFDIARINPDTKTFTFDVREKEKTTDFIIMKAIIFPYINLVWLGGIITFIGSFISMYRRWSENKTA